MPRGRKYPQEPIDRGVRLVFESGRLTAQVAADFGMRPDLPNPKEREELRRLRKENYELRRANEILKSASMVFAKDLDQDRTT